MNSNLLSIIISLVVLFMTFVLASLINRLFKNLFSKSDVDLKIDATRYKFLRHFVVGMVYIIGLSISVYIIPELRTVAKSLLAGAGILAVSVGFASQHALSNIVSGIFIILFKPFRIDDRITVGTEMGVVEDITLRHTVIRDFHNRRIVIPNSIISNETIVNSDLVDGKICKWVEIGISYNSDIDLAKSIMLEHILKHPLHLDVRTEEDIIEGVPEVTIRVVSLNDSSVQIRAWVWASDLANGFVMTCDLLESIKKAFDKSGIEIPFPHSTVYLRQDKGKSEV